MPSYSADEILARVTNDSYLDVLANTHRINRQTIEAAMGAVFATVLEIDPSARLKIQPFFSTVEDFRALLIMVGMELKRTDTGGLDISTAAEKLMEVLTLSRRKAQGRDGTREAFIDAFVQAAVHEGYAWAEEAREVAERVIAPHDMQLLTVCAKHNKGVFAAAMAETVDDMVRRHGNVDGALDRYLRMAVASAMSGARIIVV